MIDNGLKKLNNDIVVKPKNCKQCKATLTDANRVRNSGWIGYARICKKCRNKNNLKYSRKKRAIIKANPLW